VDDIRLTGEFRDEIVAHAREGAPNEVCGLIAGRNGRPVSLYRTTNDDPNPRVRYNVKPEELLVILRDIEDNGWQLLAIYHSHPANEAYPSHTDVSLAYYPDAVYIIVSLAGQEPPPMRAFRIVDGKVSEIGLVIEEEVVQRETASQS
jgi:[CysO sulfur-carrier protein]-S-L-cysteine hydrolase